MADIDVVPKRSYTWLWIVGLILLALIIWAMFRGAGTSPEVEPVGANGPVPTLTEPANLEIAV